MTTFDQWFCGRLNDPPELDDEHTFASLARELYAFISDRSDETHDCWNMADEEGMRRESMTLGIAYALMRELDGYQPVFK